MSNFQGEQLPKKKSKKFIIIPIVIIVLVIAGVFIIKNILKSGNDTVTTENDYVVKNSDIKETIFGKGLLEPKNRYEVRALVSGKVVEANYKSGDHVKKGDVLFKISETGSGAQLYSAKINLEKSKSAYSNMEKQRSDLNVKSDSSGTVVDISVHKGDMVSAGSEIAKVVDKSKLYVNAYFPTIFAGSIRTGQLATLTNDNTGEVINGRVTQISGDNSLYGGVPARMVRISFHKSGAIDMGASMSVKIGKDRAISTASIEPAEIISVRAKVSGTVGSIKIQKGQQIKNGAVVAVLNSEDLDNNIENAKLDVDLAKNSLKSEKQRLKSYIIKAPISGTIVSMNKHVGDIIDTQADAKNGLAAIYDMSSMKLNIGVDELDILKVKDGQKADIKSSALPNDVFHGVVDNVSIQGNDGGGSTSYPVSIKLDNYGKLLPGMNVTGTILVKNEKNVMAIPISCLQRGNIVYVKSENSNVNDKLDKGKKDSSSLGVPNGYKAVKVKVGASDGAMIQIISGLKLGDKVYQPQDTGDDTPTDTGTDVVVS